MATGTVFDQAPYPDLMPPPPPPDLTYLPDLVPPPDLMPPPPPPDLAIAPIYCHDVVCLPQPCCGALCTMDEQCCPGTICSPSAGRCVPSGCAACGELGCIVDYNTCTAKCAK